MAADAEPRGSPAAVRVGLIADTHGLLRPEVFAVLEGVDHILHAGDVGDDDILIELAAIAPVTAVWGNTDGMALRSRLPEIARLELGGRTVTLVHGHQIGRPTAETMLARFGGDLVVFGHSHRPEILRVAGRTAVNPGSAGPIRFADPVTVAIAVIAECIVNVERIDLVAR